MKKYIFFLIALLISRDASAACVAKFMQASSPGNASRFFLCDLAADTATGAADGDSRYNKDADTFQTYDGASWNTVGGGGGGGAPTTATYITQTPDAGLSAEQAMSALPSGLELNTTATGVQSIYAGTSCTNQFPRSLNASGTATCATVADADISGMATTKLTGTITDAQLANNYSGVGTCTNQFARVLNDNAAPTCASVVSADLNITPSSCTNQFVTALSAGGVGTCTTDTLASAQHANQGTTTQTLHGNAAGNPAWGPVVSADITDGTIVYADIQNVGALSVIGRSANSSAAAVEIQAGSDEQILRRSSSLLQFGSINLASSAAVGTSILPISNGGTNTNATPTNGGVTYGTGTAQAYSAAGAVGQGLVSNGAATPLWRDVGRIIRLTADYTNATTSMTNTVLTWAAPANSSFSGFNCTLLVKSSATTLGAQFDVLDSNAPTNIAYRLRWDSAAGTAPGTGGTQAFVTAVAHSTAVGPAAGLTTYTVWNLDGALNQGATASTITVRGKASSAGTVTVGAGSFCLFYDLL